MTFSKTRVGSVNDFPHLSDYKQSLPTKGYDKSASSWSGLDADGFMCRTSFEHNIEYRNVIQPLPTKIISLSESQLQLVNTDFGKLKF